MNVNRCVIKKDDCDLGFNYIYHANCVGLKPPLDLSLWILLKQINSSLLQFRVQKKSVLHLNKLTKI